MIKPVNDIINLCGKALTQFSEDENRLLIFHYIYYKSGIVDERVMKVPLIMTNNVKMGLGKAYRYFLFYYENNMH